MKSLKPHSTSLPAATTIHKPKRHVLDWQGRAKAASIHFVLSLCVAALAAALVFLLWFPWPFRIVSGGQELFLLIVSVDVILGPLLTFAVFNRAKPRKELVRDLAIIVALQFSALAYGLYTVYIARPVVLAFEVDRLRAVIYAEVDSAKLSEAPEGLREISLTGPKLMGTRQSRSGKEMMESAELGLAGLELSMRPSYWVPYADNKDRILKRARALDALRKQYPQQSALIDAAVAQSGKKEAELRFLPLQARRADWSVLLDAQTALPVGYVALEGFF